MDHLNALTADSLPLALAHATLNGDGGQGLGLLSGSRLSDIVTVTILAVFGTRYEEGRHLARVSTDRSPWLLGARRPVANFPTSPR